MPDSQVEEIKSKLNIEDVVSSYMQLQRAGRNLKACCPFHNEKTPSFMVNPERQIWHCFGCGEGGDIFTFVMKIEGLEFKDALKLLAERAGVKLKNVSYKDSGKKGKLMDVIEMSKRFYQECMNIKEGRKAFEYLVNRGLEKETIERFQLGYAPDSWDLLSKFLKNKGFNEKEIFDAGMMVKNERGRLYDRFRGRIMFPVNNIVGQTVGFSSRVMPGRDESQAKYINTPETLVYNKSKILYGLDKTKVMIKAKDLCVMVEGNMDVIASFQAGVENVVATSGTALTIDQLKIIKRYTNNISFSFDMDSAGIKASGRGIELALKEDMNVSVIQVPEGKDPADCAKSNPDLWRKTAEEPKQVMDFYFDSVFAKYDVGKVDHKKKIAQELLNIIAKISNKIEQTHYLQILSEKLDIDEKIFTDLVGNIEKRRMNSEMKTKRAENATKQLTEEDREKQLQERLLGFIIVYPSLFGKAFVDIEEFFSDENFGNIYFLIKELYKKESELNSKNILQLKNKISASDEGAQGQLKNLALLWDVAAFKIESAPDELPNIYEEAMKCLMNLKKIKLKKELEKLKKDIETAERRKDFDVRLALDKEYVRCVDELGKFDSI